MRILYVTQSFPPQIGGVEVLSAQLLCALKNKGHQIAAVVSSLAQSEGSAGSDYRGIPVHRFRFRGVIENRDLKGIKAIALQLKAIKQEFQPDVVHLSSWGPTPFFHQLTRSAFPARTLVTLHETIDGPLARDGTASRLLTSADWIVAISRAVLSDLRRVLPETRDRSSLISNALEMPALSPVPLVMEPLRLLCIGRLVPEKGFDTAIGAMPSVLARFPTARLIIAGDGIARQDLEQRVRSLGISSAVEFCGWVEPGGIPELINGASIVVMPSRWREPFGLVALEAAQMGRPIVATRRGGIPEIVVDGETGLLVKEDDAIAMGGAIVSLAGNPAVATRMGKAARIHAERAFSWPDFVAAYEHRYRMLGTNGGAPPPRA